MPTLQYAEPASGLLTLTNITGYGILLVKGSLQVFPPFNWKGLVSREKAKPIHSLSIDEGDPLAILNVVFDGETARYVGTCYDNYYVCDLAKKIPVWRFSQPFDPGGRFLGINQNITKALSWKRSDEKPQDSAILLWEMPKAKPVKTFPNEKEVGGAVFTKDETRFLTWRRDGTVDLWDVARKQPLRTFRCAAETAGAVFNNDATRFLAWNNSGYYDYSPRSVQLWDIAEGRLLGEFRHDAAVRGAMFHPNEDFIVSWGDDNTVRLWNVFAPEALLKLSHDANRSIEQVMRCDFDRTGERIVAQDREGSLRVWDISWSSLLGTR